MPASRVSTFGVALLALWTEVNAAPVVTTSSEVVGPDPIKIGRSSGFGVEDKDQLSTQEADGQSFDSLNLDIEQVDPTLVKRVPGDINNPIAISVNVAGWQDIAEENCYVILCQYNGNLKWQRGPQGIDKTHRVESGARDGPFQAANLDKRGTSQISQGTTSAEEFPWASLMAGGTGAHVMPATKAEQDSQGGSINSAYNHATPPVQPGEWLTIGMRNYDTTRVYCPALFKTPPDFSVCKQRKRTTLYGISIDPEDYDYIKDPSARPYIFNHPS